MDYSASRCYKTEERVAARSAATLSSVLICADTIGDRCSYILLKVSLSETFMTKFISTSQKSFRLDSHHAQSWDCRTTQCGQVYVI